MASWKVDILSASLLNRLAVSDLKVVLYKENRAPRSIALSTRMIYRSLALLGIGSLLLVVLIGMGARLFFGGGAVFSYNPSAHTNKPAQDEPTAGSSEEKIRNLSDEVARLNQQIKNRDTIAVAPKEIDKTSPALALFAPIVVDKTKGPEVMTAKNFKFTPASGKTPATLSFEFYNAHPEEGTQKGYILAVARTSKLMFAYPAEAFTTKGPYLLDFEKGETFSIGRFRMVNVQFDTSTKPDTVQLFIFSRSGELIINRTVEIPQ